MPLGIYISVPFCRTKCSYCNFASDVFSSNVFDTYVSRVCDDIARSQATAAEVGVTLDREVDSIYLGGGTPTVLAPVQLERIFATLQDHFEVSPNAEITVEVAPGTLNMGMLSTLLGLGVNRVSLGVQSFVDQESRAVGRLHTRQTTLDDIMRLRRSGIDNLNVDLIAGLPHQTAETWEQSLHDVVAAGVPHVSVYMLEVDEESRLGQELIAGGTRYHAHFVPDDDAVADFYVAACERFDAAGIRQYEISNFARGGFESRHNLKYWTRQPYLGFGVDAHSMLLVPGGARRLATPDSLEAFTSGGFSPTVTRVDACGELEEEFFLGLRLNRGVDLDALKRRFGDALKQHEAALDELVSAGLLVLEGSRLRLTPRGRLLSNEVFQRFVEVAPAAQPRVM